MAQEGWFPLLCVGLRSQWEDVHLQDLQDSYGQEWVRTDLIPPLERLHTTAIFLPPVLNLWKALGQGISLEFSSEKKLSNFSSLHLCLQTFSQRLYQEYTCYTVFFVSIEICQISDVLIRKTRRLSVFQQGFFRSVNSHH